MSNQSLFLLQWNVLLICNIFIFEDCSHISVTFLFTRGSTPVCPVFPCNLYFSRTLIILLCSLMNFYLSKAWWPKPSLLSSHWSFPILRKVEESLHVFYCRYLYLYFSVRSLLFLKEYATSRIFLQGCSLLICSSVCVFCSGLVLTRHKILDFLFLNSLLFFH